MYPEIYLTLLIQSLLISTGHSCGQITHIEISYRALEFYNDEHGGQNYKEILRSNNDALEAGNAYPDVFYPDVCFSGKFHQVSEDTHWTPFINLTMNYIRTNYPPPWDKSTQKLVSFLMGMVSHSVADVTWHSLGVDQGFLTTMGDINYHGDYTSAHSDGDLGGDVLNLYQLDLSYSDIIGDWYVPMDDLINIYKEYYGKTVISYNTLETCSKILYLSKIAERLVVSKYFPITAQHSPFLMDNLYGYFLGGVEDMSVWTQRIWQHITWGLEHGTQKCDMPYNPLYLRCNESSPAFRPDTTKRKTLKNGFYIEPQSEIVDLIDDVEVVRQGRGLTFKHGSILKKKLKNLTQKSGNSGPPTSHAIKHKKSSDIVTMKIDDVFEGKKQAEREEVKGQSKNLSPNMVLTTTKPYAKLGSALTVADLDGDGTQDLVIGSPGFSSTNGQSGAVFILFGRESGLNLTSSDIETVADLHIPGPQDSQGALFGSSLAVVDIDQDGRPELVVGAPGVGSYNLTYTGRVYVYSIVNRHHYLLKGTIGCQVKYCNLGTTLASADLTSDGWDDLILGSPYAPGGGEQMGELAVVASSPENSFAVDVNKAYIQMSGSQNYSWFGQRVEVKTLDSTWMAVGEPNLRKCALQNCSYSSADIQAIGQVKVYKVKDKQVSLSHSLQGGQELSMLGSSLSMGDPWGQGEEMMAVGATGADVDGHIAGISNHFHQAGAVLLYNMSHPGTPVSVFRGDRCFGRFGAAVKFADVNRDGVDDLIIGAPLRTKDVTGEIFGAQQGLVYIFYGGPSFPKGDATSHCSFLSLVDPCPAERASVVLELQEDLARFGSEITVIKSKEMTSVLVTAEHSSQGARLSGAVAVFNF